MPSETDQEARLEELIGSYGRLIHRIAVKLAGPKAPLLGEDIEQRVRMSLWQRLKDEQDILHPSSYVYRAAVREAVRVLREEARRAGEPLGPVPPASTAPDSDPLGSLQARETARHIEAAIDRLTPERGHAARAHLAGFEVAEVMRLYGWPYQKARNLIARAMADLREDLRSQGIDG